MEPSSPIFNLPVSTPVPGCNVHDGQREDGSFDLTQFFSHLDINSDAARYLDSLDPARFLALLKCAASPPPLPPGSLSFSRFKRRKSEPSQEDMRNYQLKLDARNQARVQIYADLKALETVIDQMEKAQIPGIDQFKRDFIAAKGFILDAVENSNARILDIHLEREFGASPATPGIPTPPSPRLGTVPLPEITPIGTPAPSGAATPRSTTQKWPSILIDPTGFAYRIIATPREVDSDSTSYFHSRPSSSAAVEMAVRSPAEVSPVAGSVTQGRPGWIRRLSGFVINPSH
ncbi:hypothetical protein FRC14_003240 [Serendipita sp. 396]|nr:hypothetical protein FRC14_003240 [Serendipita sp. 396]KAG8784772.1 hypothetical protein FRC15_002640 [Serendipita sp. 397]KAG8800554.1 hypothetical protein FRC16_002596 [Serendipita sp. 398]KAG8839081.1 hypothetical protein FRC18_000960 [Serendipita sp. 400]KAG8859886.1 hypothetical protein FRB91_006009 [Serendipita sp. 411]KAG8872717.1 hypothetical protein FRC20_009129 [Serendipita sp. 405]